MPTRRVVVTGLGAISPLGLDRHALLSGLREGRSGIRKMQSVVDERLGFEFAADPVAQVGVREQDPLRVGRPCRGVVELRIRDLDDASLAEAILGRDDQPVLAALVAEPRDPLPIGRPSGLIVVIAIVCYPGRLPTTGRNPPEIPLIIPCRSEHDLFAIRRPCRVKRISNQLERFSAERPHNEDVSSFAIKQEIKVPESYDGRKEAAMIAMVLLFVL